MTNEYTHGPDRPDSVSADRTAHGLRERPNLSAPPRPESAAPERHAAVLPERLTSLKNPRILAWRSLKDPKGRKGHEAFLVEGTRMTGEALQSAFPVQALLVGDGYPLPENVPEGVPVFLLPEHVLAAVCDTKTPQGVAAVVGIRPLPASGPRLIALDGLQDPGNVGTILRTADAAGFDGLILSPDCADVFSPKVLRATMGSIFRVGLDFPADLAARLRDLRRQGYTVISSQLDGAPFYEREDPGERFILVVGNEGAGVSPEIRSLAAQRLRLPMRGGAESLNAAVAAGIMMYELMK